LLVAQTRRSALVFESAAGIKDLNKTWPGARPQCAGGAPSPDCRQAGPQFQLEFYRLAGAPENLSLGRRP